MMRNGIQLLKSNEIRLDGASSQKLSLKTADGIRDRVVKVLVFSPLNHQMSLLALGWLSVFHEINSRSDLPGVCDRAFFYDFLFDEHGNVRPEYSDVPMVSFESLEPIRDFDMIAYGMTNPWWIRDFVRFANLTKIPIRSADRKKGDFPVLVWWGPAFANPVPYGGIFDACIVGRAEEPFLEMIGRMSAVNPDERRSSNSTRLFSNIPGVYLPEWNRTAATSVSPVREFRKLPHRYSSRILWYGTWVIVVNRGCKFECAFCQLGSERLESEDYGDVLKVVDEFFAQGITTLILNSPTFTQFPNHSALLNEIFLKAQAAGLSGFQLYVGSVRIDEIHPEYLDQLGKFDSFNHTYLKYTGDKKTSFIAVAPDFWNDRLMKLMKKGLSKDAVLQGVRNCVAGGVRNFHLYFMVGIESETESDRRDIARMAREIRELAWPESELYLKINLYIPSAQTVGQRMKMCTVSEYRTFLSEIEDELSLLFTPDEREKLHVIPLEEHRLVLEAVLMRWWEGVRPILEDILEYETFGNLADESAVREICARHWMTYEGLLERIPKEAPLPWESFLDESLLKKDRRFISKIPVDSCSIKTP